MDETQDKPLKNAFRDKKKDLAGNSDPWTSIRPGSDPYKLHGVEYGNRHVRRFRLFLRDGQVISIPYALLPVLVLEPDKSLRIVAHELEITVKGRSLHRVEEWLNEEKLLWLKEANSDLDDTEEYEVFIQKIIIDGDLLF